jgi:hypothetical protein
VRRRRYPLDPLRSLRDANVRARTLDLGRCIQSREQAEQAQAAAEGARRACEEAVRQEQQSESAQLERGVLRASDLEAQARWAQGQELSLSALRERESRARAELAGEREGEGRAQRALVHAEHAARVVEKHRADWRKREAARADGAAEDEALDVHAARVHQRGKAGGET